VKIYSSNGDAMERAKEIILGMVGDIEVGKIYRGRVVTLKDFGAFVEVLPGKDGLVHISEWTDTRVERMDKVARVGDEVWVKCIGQDDKGRSKLSRKAAMKERAAAGLEEGSAPKAS
jgi:polyribonucleotide nucleotidyltransferase